MHSQTLMDIDELLENSLGGASPTNCTEEWSQEILFDTKCDSASSDAGEFGIDEYEPGCHITIDIPAEEPLANIKIGSARFEAINNRRYELIQKKIASKLTTDEEKEFSSVQSLILKLTHEAHPLPKPGRRRG